MNKLRSTLLSVIAWFFGVVFIFGALGAFLGGSLIASLLMLVAGVLFLPPIKCLILDKNPTLSKEKITIAGAVLAVISMFFVPTDDENQVSTSESTAVEAMQEVVKEKETVEKTEVDKPIEKKNEILPTTADDVQIEMVKPSKAEKRQDINPIKARAVLDKVDQEVEAVKGFNVEDRTEAAKKSRRMKALLEEDIAPFGDENEKVGRLCDATRRQAFTYWLQVMTEKSKEDAQMSKDFLQYYQDSKKPCLDAIEEFENS